MIALIKLLICLIPFGMVLGITIEVARLLSVYAYKLLELW